MLLSAPQIQPPAKTLGTPSLLRGRWGQHPLSWPQFGLRKHHLGQTDPKAGGKGVNPGAPARTIPPCPPGTGAPKRTQMVSPPQCPSVRPSVSPSHFPQSIWDFPFIFFPIFNRRSSQNPLRGTPAPHPFFSAECTQHCRVLVDVFLVQKKRQKKKIKPHLFFPHLFFC